MNVKAVLESHKNIKTQITVILKEVEQMRALSEDVIANSSEAKRMALYNKVVDIDKMLNEKYNSYVDIQAKMNSLINTLDDELELIALKCVYILHYTNERTAREMGYSVRQVSRFLKSGLDKL